ncbi:MAG: glycosyltransferase [Candidatus Nomurabacteria bacterium]|nr:glycosyltransferase [Candidatus Nomurabacteria bacterium]USN88022.1 MAG: glycosyltransferase [Candidatus Nomurabacteria bacterium]
MKISILIPCHNEEKSIEACVSSCLNQTRLPDQVIVVNDGSTDRSGEILKKFGDRIQVITLPKATGNKSYAQEIGLKFVTGDVFISTDGDTMLNERFVEFVEEDYTKNPELTAVGGYVRSLRHNWLTACRAYEYAVGQNLHKLAQHHLAFLFVIPGAAGVFRTEHFNKYISFEHDTLTEDLDFTYRLHEQDLKIMYDRRIIVYTQDPATLHSYINQMRRWFAGGWQCLLKHRKLVTRQPKVALELSMMYIEGTIFAFLLFVLPFISLKYFGGFILAYFAIAILFAIFAAWKEKRPELLLIPIPYAFIMVINSYIFLEQMVKEVILRRKNLTWFHPQRFTSNHNNN